MLHRFISAVCASLVLSVAAHAHSEYEQVVELLNPIHWWRFSDIVTPPTSTVDDEVGGLHGVWHNGPILVDGLCDPDDPAAQFWNAQGPTWGIFDHSPTLQLAEGTISFCMIDTTKILEAAIFSKDANGFGGGGHLTIGTLPGANITTGSLYARLQSDSASHLVTTEPIDINVLYHVTFSFGPQGMKLYIDGNLVDENPYSGGMLANLEPFVLGASTAYSGQLSADPLRHYWSGILDEVLIFDYALTPEQVVTLYQQRLPQIPEPAGLSLLAFATVLLARRRRRG